MNRLLKIIEILGERSLALLNEIGTIGLLLCKTLILIPARPFEPRNLVKQIVMVGFNSIPVVLITATFTGMVLALQTYAAFQRFGAESLIGTVVALSMTRELGPVFAGLMVSGRVGAAMAAELGTMKVTEQIDALWTLATNPVKYLVVPRFLAGAIIMPCLVLIADIVGIFGGYLVAVKYVGVSSYSYMENTFRYLDLGDIYGGLIKSVVFGMIIAIVSCHEGYNATGGAEGVGQATTRAVVTSCVMVLISDYFLTAILW
jgi:phospholipid/cholesterol/gamma-HCH transport system permease protein